MERTPLARALVQDRFENFCDISQQLRGRESQGVSYLVDLSDAAICGSAGASAIRLHMPSVMTLANLISGRFRRLSLRVRLPDADSINRQLARGGIFHAIARRPGSTHVENEPVEWLEAMESWNRDFHPSDCRMRRDALVDSKIEPSPTRSMRAAFQRQLFSVVQPHMRKAIEVGDDMRPLASTWLTDRLGVPSNSEVSTQIDDYLGVFQQIVVNICEHARIEDTKGGSSLAQIFATYGGGERSQNRLQLMVVDNGYGLSKSLPERYRDKHRNAAESLTDALMGDLPGFDGARGRGLKYVRETAMSNYRSSGSGVTPNRISVITVGDAPESAAVMNWSADSADPTVQQYEDVPVMGTLVMVSLGLRLGSSDGESVQDDELAMDFSDDRRLVASQRA